MSRSSETYGCTCPSVRQAKPKPTEPVEGAHGDRMHHPQHGRSWPGGGAIPPRSGTPSGAGRASARSFRSPRRAPLRSPSESGVEWCLRSHARLARSAKCRRTTASARVPRGTSPQPQRASGVAGPHLGAWIVEERLPAFGGRSAAVEWRTSFAIHLTISPTGG